jgi:hypothetical protein
LIDDRTDITRAVCVALVLIVLVSLGVAGCGADPELEGARSPAPATVSVQEDSTTIASQAAVAEELPSAVADATSQVDEAEQVKVGELGERRNPIPVGQQAQVGDWEVNVVGAALDATQAVLDENMFNNPPEDGHRYVLVALDAIYGGEGSSTFWVDMMYAFVGSKGERFDVGKAVAPDPITETGEALPGVCISGNVIFDVASDQVSGGTLLVEEAFAIDKAGIFFAIE